MDISLKYGIIEQIIQSSDDALLRQIKMLLDSDDKEDFWKNLSEESRSAIHLAKDELEQGKGIPHATVMKGIRAQFKS